MNYYVAVIEGKIWGIWDTETGAINDAKRCLADKYVKPTAILETHPVYDHAEAKRISEAPGGTVAWPLPR